ncbi:para-aminobenzoic acid synthetase [Ramaria rubella]|nr:para-aminobenzoic acid synthetase [Ramaria rubella]
MVPVSPKILLIDSYDSFTHNLAHLIRRNVPSSQIYLIRNDTLDYETLLPLLSCFSAIVVGPGPGSPDNDADVGIIRKLWSLSYPHILPIFGVCLGFQSLTLAFGGCLRTMPMVKHGMVSRIEHVGHDLFQDVEDIEATRYHSLCVDLIDKELCSEIEPLAWAEDGEENGQILMAVRHRHKPFWGVQYHPESICTRGGGDEVIRNFWNLAVRWAAITEREVQSLPLWAKGYLGEPWPHTLSSSAVSSSMESFSVSYVSLDLPHLSPTQVCELLGVNTFRTNFVMLDSAAKSGRFTIIGALLSSTLSIRYTIPDRHILLQRGDEKPEYECIPPGSSIWDWLATFMTSRVVRNLGPEDVPFWGGLVGYLSYELGVVELGVPLKHRRVDGSKGNADVNLVFVERSIVLDGETGRVYVQSLFNNDVRWLHDMSCQLKKLHPGITNSNMTSPLRSCLTSPSREVYVPQVLECKHHLSVGSSYELCLTAPSTLHVHTSSGISSWDLYARLRSSNPAPHAAFLRLGPTTLLCSSPERFLKWDRLGGCQLRPIKGTLRKTIIDEKGNTKRMLRADADKLLGENIKERAENLMIVDLVRHDLGGVVEAADGVSVEQLMGIEEYETVWQMVSVISGTVGAGGGGWEVLRRSLPPGGLFSNHNVQPKAEFIRAGSMTGAPKKRSVELLQDIEGQERGVYSGVCGYWCVGGAGDWAVVIRSCFRHDDHDTTYHNGESHGSYTRQPRGVGEGDSHLNGEDSSHNSNGPHLNGRGQEQNWTLGAGGAITALSDPVAEWEEMRVKLSSVGRAFGVDEL